LLSGYIAFLLWKRGSHRELRSFFLYAAFQFVQWAVLYPIDLIPAVPAPYYWRAYWLSSLIESAIAFWVISDIFADVSGSYEALAQLGKLLIRWAGAILLIVATAVAAYAPIENRFWIIPACHILHEAMYIVVSGLILLLFACAAYFRLTWKRRIFGIALGIGFSACVHLAIWALADNGGLAESVRNVLDFVNLASTHVTVLIWYYYLLVPQKAVAKSAVPLPDGNLAVWNRELERLLQ